MTVKRGPQSVQVMKGNRYRRLPGSNSSGAQPAQMAMSGEPASADRPCATGADLKREALGERVGRYDVSTRDSAGASQRTSCRKAVSSTLRALPLDLASRPTRSGPNRRAHGAGRAGGRTGGTRLPGPGPRRGPGRATQVRHARAHLLPEELVTTQSSPRPVWPRCRRTRSPGMTCSAFSTARSRSNLQVRQEVHLVDHRVTSSRNILGYLSGLSSPSVTEKTTIFACFAKVPARRADEVPDVLDEEQPGGWRSMAPSAVEDGAESRWHAPPRHARPAPAGGCTRARAVVTGGGVPPRRRSRYSPRSDPRSPTNPAALRGERRQPGLSCELGFGRRG